MRKNRFLRMALFVTVILFLSSCVNDKLEEFAPSNNAKSMNELIAPKDFQWRTSQTVTVDITGLPTLQPVKSTLTIGDNTSTYYSGFHLMSQNHLLSIEVPAIDKELKLKFGAIEQTATIKDGKASFSFIPIVTDNN
ncbi:MAG: hypothetical protein ACOYOT_03230 [Bacteroidales bacterium]